MQPIEIERSALAHAGAGHEINAARKVWEYGTADFVDGYLTVAGAEFGDAEDESQVLTCATCDDMELADDISNVEWV